MASGAQGTRGCERGPASQPADGLRCPGDQRLEDHEGARKITRCTGGEEDHEVHPHLIARGCGGSGSSGEHMLAAVCCQQR